MIRTIQIGGPNGPLVQGRLIGAWGGYDVRENPVTWALIRDGSRAYTGRLVDSYRRDE